MTMPPSVIVSVDGGQTSTKALVARPDGTVLGFGRGGPTVHYHSEGGVEKNRASVQGAILAALENAAVDPGRVVSVGLGITGVPEDGDEIPTIHEIVRGITSPEAINVSSDTRTSLYGASGGEPGIVVIAGGGAIGYGLTAGGDVAISNGFGYWIGDEGSAFWIGMRAIDEACRAADRRGPATALERVVLGYFDLDEMRDLPRIVYRADFRRDRISQLAPAVFSTARDGDPLAMRIVTDGAHELALTATGVLRQLHSPGTAAIVYPAGGVFTEHDLFFEPFERYLAKLWPEAEVRVPRFPPAVGGLIVAARAVGVAIDAGWLDRVERGLAGAMP